MSNNMAKDVVQAGACLSPSGEFSRCVLERTSCPAGSTFLSSREIEKGTNADTKICLTNNSVDAIPVGRCESDIDERLCTSVAENCQFASSFTATSPTCNVRSDNGRTSNSNQFFHSSIYGQCTTSNTANYFCGWSPEDCPESDTWLVANHHFVHNRGYCTCDQVRVGNCVDNVGQRYCAVSAQACDSESTYKPVTEATLECYLCSTEVTASPTASPTTQWEKSLLNRPGSLNNPSGSNSDNQTQIAIIIAIVVGALVVISGLVYFAVRRDGNLRGGHKNAVELPTVTSTVADAAGGGGTVTSEDVDSGSGLT